MKFEIEKEKIKFLVNKIVRRGAIDEEMKEQNDNEIKQQDHNVEQVNYKRIIFTGIFYICAFFLGGGLAQVVNADQANKLAQSNHILNSKESNWGLGFSTEGQPPTGNATSDELKKHDAYYMGDANSKKIYLTFDAGFENGFTPTILDALKKHNVSATFFLVGNYIKTSPDLVKRMIDEGHTVANHTYNHPNMSTIGSKEKFKKELEDLEVLFEETTGKKMIRHYRPPQGKYSEDNLAMAKELGYKTFFWSLAYVDWYVDKQPSRDEAFKKLLGRIHPGAIVLLHSTSKTNADIMDELIMEWKDMGYNFGTLEELTANQ